MWQHDARQAGRQAGGRIDGRAGQQRANRAALTRISMLQSMAGRPAYLAEVPDTSTYRLLANTHTQTHRATLCVQSQSRVHNAWTNIGVVWHIHIAALTPTPTKTSRPSRHGSRFLITQRVAISMRMSIAQTYLCLLPHNIYIYIGNRSLAPMQFARS